MLEQLLARIRSNDPTLTDISLSGSGKRIGVADAHALAEGLKVNTTLRKMSLGLSEIDAAGAQALAKGLKDNTTLKQIDMEWNKIGDEGTQALAEVLKLNTTVTQIALGLNRISALGAQALAEALKVNSTLTHIGLPSNKIGAVGAQALAQALKTNTSVTAIDLNWNNIGDAGAQALAEALKVNANLTEINLGHNNIGAAGAQSLAEALKANSTLTHIGLPSNKIGDEGAQALAKVLKVNTTVTQVALGSNRISVLGAQAFAEMLKVNQTVMHIELGHKCIRNAGVQAKKQIEDYLERNQTNARKLIEAAKKRDAATVKNLLALGVSVNYQDENGKTALDYAVEGGDLEIIYLLLNSPQLSNNQSTVALVNKLSNQNGNTLLHQVVLLAENHSEMAHKVVERLLAFGVKRYVKNQAGHYPYQLCTPSTAEEKSEWVGIRDLLKPTPAEQRFIDHIENNPHIKQLIEKLSKTLLTTDELIVSLRSDKTKQHYALPGDLLIRLLFEELQQFRSHVDHNDFDCETASTWEQLLAICLSNYENMTNNVSKSQVSKEAERLTDEESELLKELILNLQQINQLIFQAKQTSAHRDELIESICIPREWVEEYELGLVETRTNEKRKRADKDKAALPSAKRQKNKDLDVESLEKKIHELEQKLVLSQTEVTDLKQKLAELSAAKDSENSRAHSAWFFPRFGN